MRESPIVDVAALIDKTRFGALQIRITVLCGLIALLDGLDLQSIGLAAPAIGAALHIPPPAFGTVFSTALAGLALGAFVLGPVADRFGRKGVLIGSTLCFGLFTIGTALVRDYNELLICRFLTGAGLGGAMPSFIALTAEYAPRRHRSTIVALLWAGFPLGGVVGGLLAARLIPAFGWQSIFWAGGVTPIVLAAVLAIALPELIGFLVERGAPAQRIAGILRRLGPTVVIPSDARFILGNERPIRVSLGALFAERRGLGTVLLWISFFIAFGMLVTNSAWAPTLLGREGIALPDAAIALATYNLGSVIGTIGVGWLIARFGAAVVLTPALVVSAVAFAGIGQAPPSVMLVTLLQGLFGLSMGCASSGLIAVAALFYPTAIRSTGVGWAMGIGRVGSFTGPLVVANLLGRHWAIDSIFLALAAPALVAAIATAAVRVQRAPTMAEASVVAH